VLVLYVGALLMLCGGNVYNDPDIRTNSSEAHDKELIMCMLWLPDRTRITLAPRNMTVNVSTTVELECRAETDERELSSLSVHWFKDGLVLSRNRDPRLRVDHVVGTLRLADAQVYDTGIYRCVAGTDVDTDSAHAQLIVKGFCYL